MSRPFKHPNSGFYWLRKAVPADLRALVGKREEKQSLGTKDAAEAKRRYALVIQEIDERWANLRSGPKDLSEREAHELAHVCYDTWLSQHRENPSLQDFWDVRIGEGIFPKTRFGLSPRAVTDILAFNEADVQRQRMESQCLATASKLLAEHGISNSDTNRQTLAKAVAAAIQRASQIIQRLARGEFVDEARQPISRTIASKVSRSAVKFDELVEGWAQERRPVEKTVYEWSRVCRQLVEYLGYDDVGRIRDDDLLRWKASMVTAGLKPKTIQDAKLAPVRTILQWGFRNKKLSSNPADGISLDVRTKHSERKRSFTDEEAKLILKAAQAASDPVRKWIPWLCCYSGARISEVSQLRREDILQVDGSWCLKFTAEAGSLKTSGSERLVPIHAALLHEGFLDFIEQVSPGPIFHELPPDKFGKRGGNATKIIGKFVRNLGLKDPRLSPAHSWRHRLKTQARRYGLASDVVDAIVGHSPKSVGDSYGEFPVSALVRELSKIPKIAL